jgi:hypothetical protein
LHGRLSTVSIVNAIGHTPIFQSALDIGSGLSEALKSSEVPPQLQVEIEVLRQVEPQSFELLFQSFPVWLLALDPPHVKQIYLPSFDDVDHLVHSLHRHGIDSILVHRALHRFGIKRLRSGRSSSDTTTYIRLVSGSLAYLLPYLLEHTGMVLGVLESHHTGRLRHQRPTGIPSRGYEHITWHRIRHTSVAGCTKFCALFGVNSNKLVPKTTTLRRTIRHYLDYSICPGHTTTDELDLLTPDDLLHPRHMQSPVRYHTSFTSTGVGVRRLTTDEIANMYGLHSRLRMGTTTLSTLSTIIPVALLDSLLFPLLRVPATPNALSSELHTARFAVNIDTDQTCLPELQVFLSHQWISSDLVTDKAAKRDDADVPVSLWNRRITFIFPHSQRAIDWLRTRLLLKSGRRLYLEFVHYLSSTYGCSWSMQLTHGRSLLSKGLSQSHSGGYTFFQSLHLDALVGADCIQKYFNSTWWQWTRGSTLFFWRWGIHSTLARDGHLPHIKGPLPHYLTPAKRPKQIKIPLLVPKFQLVLDRGYVQPGVIRSFIDYFDVPKADDIRLVYNGTSCGLNAALWAPNFWLPTAKTALRSLDFNFYSVDMDLGDMFLNFPLHRELQSYSGIDLTPLKRPLGITTPGPFHVHWTRCWMGSKPSPFYAVSFFYIAEEFVRGNHIDKDNPLRWDDIVLNIPGDPAYTPSKPRVFKWDKLGEHIAGDLAVFDMIRIVRRVPRIGLVCLLGLKPWDWNNARK